MRSVTELHNKHLNQPIWIVGSDPSLEEYPNDFLDDKIAITLHLAYLKFPNATYRYFEEKDRVTFLNARDPEFKNKISICALPFYGKSPQDSLDTVKNFKEVYHIKVKSYPGLDNQRAYVKQAKEGIDRVYGGHATCLHDGFFSAIMMGGNPINLIGCNHETIRDKDHFGEADPINLKMRPNRPMYSQGKGNKMKIGTKAIINGCRDNGIKVNWIRSYNNGDFLYIDKEFQSTPLSKMANSFTKL